MGIDFEDGIVMSLEHLLQTIELMSVGGGQLATVARPQLLFHSAELRPVCLWAHLIHLILIGLHLCFGRGLQPDSALQHPERLCVAFRWGLWRYRRKWCRWWHEQRVELWQIKELASQLCLLRRSLGELAVAPLSIDELQAAHTLQRCRKCSLKRRPKLACLAPDLQGVRFVDQAAEQHIADVR